eukprot:g2389.t1
MVLARKQEKADAMRARRSLERELLRRHRIDRARERAKKIEKVRNRNKNAIAERRRVLEARVKTHDVQLQSLERKRQAEIRKRSKKAKEREEMARARVRRAEERREDMRNQWIMTMNASEDAKNRALHERSKKERERREKAIIREERRREVLARVQRMEQYKVRKTEVQLQRQRNRVSRRESEKEQLRREMQEQLKKQRNTIKHLIRSASLNASTGVEKGRTHVKDWSRYSRDNDFLRGEAFYKNSGTRDAAAKRKEHRFSSSSSPIHLSLSQKMSIVESLRRTQNAELLSILGTEQDAETHRIQVRERVRSAAERRKLDRKFNEERVKISHRIMKLTERHESELASKLAELDLGHVLRRDIDEADSTDKAGED